jgi:hypothetical protein
MLSSCKKVVYFLLCLLLCTHISSAQHNPAFRLNNYTVSFTADLAAWSNPVDAAPRLVLIRFETIRSKEQKSTLLSAHIKVLDYLGANTYSALLEPLARPADQQGITGIAAFDWAYKVTGSIVEQSRQATQVLILARFIKDLPAADISRVIAASGATVVPNGWQKKGLYMISLPASGLAEFASFYGVDAVSEPSQNIPLDLDSKGGEGASVLNMPAVLGGKDLRGKNIVIGHGDNCSGIYHIDQRDRTINYNTANATEHGVLVNGIMAGEGIIDPAGQGVATEGTCISLFFDAVLQVKEELYKGFNATLTNNSYAAIVGSCGYSGLYDNLSRQMDELAFVTTEQLDVFAAGNDGTLVCSGYPAGYFNVCGGYQTAKNVLTVGSTFRDYKISNTSGRGPIRDGRVKPEICAVGANIYCPIPSNTYRFQSGTSLACPQVTGILALLTERYRQLNGGANPRSDLLKAIAINGASDFGRPGPDFWYGFGFINAVRSLELIEQSRYTRNTIAAGDPARSFTVNVPANTAQLKVLLYYHDPAANTAASTQLVNDLDVTVAEPGGGATHRPLVLDASIVSVGNNATEGVDRLNNAEQVVINNPAAGIYSISVSGFSIPEGPQDYVVAYDFVPKEIKLLFPIAHAAAAANTDLYIYWEAPADASTAIVEFSPDNGSSWTTIAASVDAGTRTFKWTTPAINSNQCRVRITSGSYTDISGAFTINEQTIVSLAADQCPGSVRFSWTNVPGADKYYMLIKKGTSLQKADSVAATVLHYTFTGLNTHDDYFVAVLPSFGGREGFRSKAVMRKPDDGSCAAVQDGDIALEAVLSPETGRRYTGSALKSNTAIKVRVRNQDDDPALDYSILYRVNSGPWNTSGPFSIPANSSLEQLVDVSDFSTAGTYRLTMVVKNNISADPVLANDTLVKVIRQLPNDAIILSSKLLQDFESLPDLTLLRDTIGMDNIGYWDYTNSNDTGRLRTRIPGSPLVKTSRSVSMDVTMNTKENVNYFTGTFNLSAYDTTADEVRFDFDYEMRGNPLVKDSNKVWVRGTDEDSWIQAFEYDTEIDTAKLHESGTISFRELFRRHGQNFSGSTQIRFGQYDTTVIVDDHFGAGLTIDNVNLYKVNKDLQLPSVVAPAKSNCNISESTVSIKIKNGTSNPMSDIILAYILDGSAPITDTFSGTIPGDETTDFTFSKGLAGLAKGPHTLKVWLNTPGDDLLKNDTIADYSFYIAPMISTFPYLEDFETANGSWYTGGRNISWAYGAIAGGRKINKAASGTKAWKTSLSGVHRSNELSYLISPCLNTSALSAPTLSFSTAFEIEHCEDSRCDGAYIEYSIDNEQSWSRLGTAGSGTNWYNDGKNQVWSGDQSRWHVASVSLPKVTQLKLRFVMSSDAGTNLEGIAIDDIHIFDLQQRIASLSGAEQKSSEQAAIAGSAWFYFLNSNELLAAVNPAGNALIRTDVFGHTTISDPVHRQYFAPRSWLLEEQNGNTGDAAVRLFITDAEVNKIWSDTACKGCSRANDIYRTGITRYAAQDRKNEDNSLTNNLNPQAWSFLPFNKVKWVPYDNGYYVQFLSIPRGEFWLNDGGIPGTLPLNTEYVWLQATKVNEQQVRISWQSAIDTAVKEYSLERSKDSITFSPVSLIPSRHSVSQTYTYMDEPGAGEGDKIYYRLFCTAENSRTFYSNTEEVDWIKGDQLLSVYPIPSANGDLTIKWTGLVGSSAELSLTDASGKNILQTTLRSENWPNTHVLHLAHLSKGTYFLKFYIGNSKYTEKVVFK